MHAYTLKNELKRYFPDVSEGNLKLIRDPIHSDVASVNDAFRKNLLNLSMTPVPVIYMKKSLVRFWCKISKSYPNVAEEPLRSLLLYPSTYLCETGYSSLLVIKSKLKVWTECGRQPSMCFSKNCSQAN